MGKRAAERKVPISLACDYHPSIVKPKEPSYSDTEVEPSKKTSGKSPSLEKGESIKYGPKQPLVRAKVEPKATRQQKRKKKGWKKRKSGSKSGACSRDLSQWNSLQLNSNRLKQQDNGYLKTSDHNDDSDESEAEECAMDEHGGGYYYVKSRNEHDLLPKEKSSTSDEYLF